MSAGNEWDTITPGSATKLNGVTVIYGTGDYLSGLDKTKHKLVVCTATGSGLTLDHVYLASASGTTWLDVTDPTAGGSSGVIDSYISEPKFFDLVLTKTNDLQKAQWNQTTTSTGTIADDTDGTFGDRSIKLLTGATSGSAATIAYPHMQLDFSKTSVFHFMGRFSATTALAAHSGVNADDVTAADSNTVKYNAEVCTVTNTNWFLRSANGSSNSTSDTGTAFTTNRVGVRIEHYPTAGTPRVDMYIDAGTVFSKTSNIPISGQTADNNLIKHSLKNSAAADKNYFVYGSRLLYTINDQWI